MCGIIGVSLKEDDAPERLESGLVQMKYRGYDSAGMAVLEEGQIQIKKVLGAETKELKDIPASNIGIAHRRWSTHGKTTIGNQHPHLSKDGDFAVVHNGCIENYHDLRERLTAENIQLETGCDTEIIPNLISYFRQKVGSVLEAIRQTANLLNGKNSFIVLSRPDGKLYSVQNGLPLTVGHDESGIYIASDTKAFIKYTQTGYQFDKGQMFEVLGNTINFFDIKSGEDIERRRMEFGVNEFEIDKGKFPHLMLKEIWDQKEGLQNCLEHNIPKLNEVKELVSNARIIYIVGCGTAYKVACFGAMQMNRNRKISFAYPGSEAGIPLSNATNEDLVIFISQSGTTGDLIGLEKELALKNVPTIGLINVECSYLAENVEHLFPLKVGTEAAVASTKATSAQMLLSYLLASSCKENPDISIQEAAGLPGYLDQFLNDNFEEFLKEIAKIIVYKEDPKTPIGKLKIFFKKNINKLLNLNLGASEIFIIGSGIESPVAKEAEIKISEVSYIGARGFVAGEVKHGYIARIEEGFPCIVLLDSESYEQTINNATQCKSRGAKLIGIGPKEYNKEGVFDQYINVPNINGLQPILNLIPIQLLAYYIALERGLPIDFPRNLAKSVTVK